MCKEKNSIKLLDRTDVNKLLKEEYKQKITQSYKESLGCIYEEEGNILVKDNCGTDKASQLVNDLIEELVIAKAELTILSGFGKSE